MYAGAAITALTLLISIVSLAFFGRSGATLRLAGSSQPFWVAVTVGVAGGLLVIALWLWMARATSRGRSWARLLSTVLFGLATLELVSFSEAPSVLGLLFWAPTWLAGLGAVWQLWRAASGVFFRGIPHDRARPAVAKMQR